MEISILKVCVKAKFGGIEACNGVAGDSRLSMKLDLNHEMGNEEDCK